MLLLVLLLNEVLGANWLSANAGVRWFRRSVGLRILGVAMLLLVLIGWVPMLVLVLESKVLMLNMVPNGLGAIIVGGLVLLSSAQTDAIYRLAKLVLLSSAQTAWLCLQVGCCSSPSNDTVSPSIGSL